MKQLLVFVLLLSISQYSCQQQSDQSLQADGPKEKASRMSAFATESTPYAFQQISTPVDLSLPEDDRKAPVEQIYAKIKERRAFLAQSGLPILDAFTPPTAENRDWKKLDQKYRQFLIAQQGHRYLPIFRRLGSVVILKDFALLADEDPAAKQAVAFYTNELLETGGHANAALMYYCLRALEGTWSTDQLRKYAQESIKANQKDPSLHEMRQVPTELTSEQKAAIDPQLIEIAKIRAEQDEYLQKLRLI